MVKEKSERKDQMEEVRNPTLKNHLLLEKPHFTSIEKRHDPEMHAKHPRIITGDPQNS